MRFSIANLVYELPRELSYDLRVRILHAHGTFTTERASMPTQEKKELGSYEIKKIPSLGGDIG